MFQKKYSLNERDDYHLKKAVKTGSKYSIGFCTALRRKDKTWCQEYATAENCLDKGFDAGFRAGMKAEKRSKEIKW